jgi:uncharacterized protein YdbL (DUF1318 family)
MARVTANVVSRFKEYMLHLARGGDMVAKFLLALAGSRVLELGGPVVAPTAASTQATGATGALAWRVNMPWVLAAIDGGTYEKAAVADFVVFSGASTIPNGSAATAAIVAYLSSAGVLTFLGVVGASAVGLVAAGPGDAAVDAAVKAANGAVAADWVKVAETTFARTGDINTFTQTHNNTKADLGLVVNTPPNLLS